MRLVYFRHSRALAVVRYFHNSKMFCSCLGLLKVIGLYALCCYLYENFRAPVLMLRATLRRIFGKESTLSLKQRYGAWAAITGATDGIGKAYARGLARQGLNVVLISRTESKLRDVATAIEREFDVQTKWIVADFTKGKEVYSHIEKELGELQIGILVNNVGANTSRIDVMSSFEEIELWNVIHTNVAAVTILSRLFILRMQKAEVKGIIVNISSGTELQPIPFAALYAASKAFTRSLTLALQEEARPLGISVQLVSPNFVVTKINSYSKLIMHGGLLIPQPDTYARWAVSTIGVVDITTGYFWHGVQNAVNKLFTWNIRMAIGYIIFKKFYMDAAK